MANVVSTLLAGFVGGLASQSVSFLLGWAQETRTDKKKDTRETIDEAINTIAKITDTANRVWSVSGSDSIEQQRETVCLIHELSELLSYIWEFHPKYKIALFRNLTEFHRTVTGEDFDMFDRGPKPERDLAIRSRASTLRIELKKAKRQC